MERGHEYDRRCASAAPAGVASSIVEERPPIRRIPTDDEPDEDGVIPTGHSAALLALDVGDYPLDHRNAALVFRVADAAEAVGLIGRKPARQSFLFRGENIEDEMPSALERGVHVVLLVDRYEDERRIERDRRDRARGHTDRLAIRLAGRQHRHAGRKAPQQLAELRRVDTARSTGHQSNPAMTRGWNTARAGTQFPVARTSRSASSGRRVIRFTTRSMRDGHPTARPMMRSSTHFPANSRRRARVSAQLCGGDWPIPTIRERRDQTLGRELGATQCTVDSLAGERIEEIGGVPDEQRDRKSTRLNSSH